MKIWPYTTHGIPDELFERVEGVPITKEEIRAIQISKARLCAGYTVWDVGCGSGSISVEAALQVGQQGRVLGVDHNPDAVSLSRRNAALFGVEIQVLLDEAVHAIPSLPIPDAVFVGGTGGQTAEILRLCAGRLRQGGRIVVATIQVETLVEVIHAVQDSGLVDMDITGVSIQKSRGTSTGTMMLARNPVAVVAATASL